MSMRGRWWGNAWLGPCSDAALTFPLAGVLVGCETEAKNHDTNHYVIATGRSCERLGPSERPLPPPLRPLLQSALPCASEAAGEGSPSWLGLGNRQSNAAKCVGPNWRNMLPPG